MEKAKYDLNDPERHPFPERISHCCPPVEPEPVYDPFDCEVGYISVQVRERHDGRAAFKNLHPDENCRELMGIGVRYNVVDCTPACVRLDQHDKGRIYINGAGGVYRIAGLLHQVKAWELKQGESLMVTMPDEDVCDFVIEVMR
jgi:hypothetical protein